MKNLLYNLVIVTASSAFFSCQSPVASEVSVENTDAEKVKKIIDEKNDQLEIWYKAGLIDSATT